MSHESNTYADTMNKERKKHAQDGKQQALSCIMIRGAALIR